MRAQPRAEWIMSSVPHLNFDPAAAIDYTDPRLYLNRELSWLEFNRRVLHEALDERTPLLDRVGFQAIFTSNLDEFFMKRVGGLKRQIASSVTTPSLDGRTPAQQLALIRESILPMLRDQARCFRHEIMPELRLHGVALLDWDELTSAERAEASRYFRANLFPVLTPLAVDPGHPFPFLSNLSESLGVVVSHPGRGEKLFARVKVPQGFPRWVELLSGKVPNERRFVRLEDIIQNNLTDLFPEMEIQGVMRFRVTRNADVERDEEDTEDLLEMIEEELRARRFAQIVRLEHGPNPDPWILQFLIDELELTEQDVYELPAEMDYTGLRVLCDLPLAKLKAEPWTPLTPAQLADAEADIFSVIRSSDMLVHHPYESFTASVERFVSAAAGDPRVLAVKMTLYRTGEDSPFIEHLIRAAETGKQVVVLVEVKARFDEQRNIRVAQMLEAAGVHVVYGIIGLKTHAKTILVVRREPDGLRSYVHIGTGNYHAGNARLYTDLGLFTARPEFTEDVVELFHYLTGRSGKRDYRKLLVAPVSMKKRFLEMIEQEVENHKNGRPAAIIAKMNSLEDQQVIAALYRASAAGVPIQLVVRGFCCLRPGIKHLSENIQVISVIGRFLEHSRIFYFRSGAADWVDGRFFIGSADWMYRNLQNRVEAVTPIEDRPQREKVWNVLQVLLGDQRQAWEMQSDGSYIQREPADDPATQLGSHRTLMQQATARWRTALENGGI